MAWLCPFPPTCGSPACMDSSARPSSASSPPRLGRVAGRPSATLPADAASLMRDNARSLAATLRAAQAKPGLSKETRAHYAESLNTLEEALKAPLQRAGV